MIKSWTSHIVHEISAAEYFLIEYMLLEDLSRKNIKAK